MFLNEDEQNEMIVGLCETIHIKERRIHELERNAYSVSDVERIKAMHKAVVDDLCKALVDRDDTIANLRHEVANRELILRILKEQLDDFGEEIKAFRQQQEQSTATIDDLINRCKAAGVHV